MPSLVAKIRREERYHLLHVDAWLRRLAGTPGEPRDRLSAALETLRPDATTVFSPLPGEERLVAAGIVATSMASLRERWLAEATAILVSLALPVPDPAADLERGRLDHSSAFRWLWGEFTSVRRLDPVAAW